MDFSNDVFISPPARLLVHHFHSTYSLPVRVMIVKRSPLFLLSGVVIVREVSRVGVRVCRRENSSGTGARNPPLYRGFSVRFLAQYFNVDRPIDVGGWKGMVGRGGGDNSQRIATRDRGAEFLKREILYLIVLSVFFQVCNFVHSLYQYLCILYSTYLFVSMCVLWLCTLSALYVLAE